MLIYLELYIFENDRQFSKISLQDTLSHSTIELFSQALTMTYFHSLELSFYTDLEIHLFILTFILNQKSEVKCRWYEQK